MFARLEATTDLYDGLASRMQVRSDELPHGRIKVRGPASTDQNPSDMYARLEATTDMCDGLVRRMQVRSVALPHGRTDGTRTFIRHTDIRPSERGFMVVNGKRSKMEDEYAKLCYITLYTRFSSPSRNQRDRRFCALPY